MFSTSLEFIEACEDQGVRLSDRTIDALSVSRSSVESPIHCLVEGCLRDLTYACPTDRVYLESGQIDTETLPDNGSMLLLGALLNLTVGVEDTRPSAYTAQAPSLRTDSLCTSVEKYWCNAIEAARENPPRDPEVQVFVDANGQPVLVRKSEGHPTGVLLAPVRANIGKTQKGRQVVYPEGTLVNVSSVVDPQVIRGFSAKDQTLALPNYSSLVSPIQDLTGLSYGRLSPLMYDDERLRGEQHAYKVTAENPMTGLREIANLAIDLARS